MNARAARLAAAPPRQVGRCLLFSPLASGGMATVFLARMQTAAGLVRTVAVKEMHPQFANNPDIVAMFLDEARLATRIAHPNIVPTLDVMLEAGGLYLVMDYVAGEPLGNVLRSCRKASLKLDPAFASAVMRDALMGLHAAHEATDEFGEPLSVVHRDVSPQNIIVGQDGLSRVLDFGIAKARGRVQETTDIAVKGKLRYMAPEQLTRQPIDQRVDVFTAGIVLWESLTGRALFESEDVGSALAAILHAPIAPPSHFDSRLSAACDAVVLRALERDPRKRFASAQEFADALTKAITPATPQQVAALLAKTCGPSLAARAAKIADIEAETLGDEWPPKHLLTLRTVPDVATNPAVTALTKKRPTTLWLWLGGVAAVGAGAIYLKATPREQPRPQEMRALPTPSPTVTQIAAPPAPVIETPAITEPIVAAPAPQRKAKPRRAPIKKAVANKAAAKPPATPVPGKKADCEIPWVIGPNGVRTPKAGCF
ncbi:MAG: serine/threonine-protein kinase [Deltaproteobacteria bacterium]|nr:serine/threonine-protein kinase [Deltaproteobacteria bacterium]